MRIGVFKKYWNKFKYNKSRREHLMEMFDASDEQFAFYMGEEFKPWKDEIEGARDFLIELSQKKVDNDIRLQKAGNTVIRNIAGRHVNE